jgi:transposase-like protein
MNKRAYQRYSAEFKEKALGLLELGKPTVEVAQDLEISTNLLYTWRSQACSLARMTCVCLTNFF